MLRVTLFSCPEGVTVSGEDSKEIGKKYANLAKQDPGRARQNR